MKTIDESTLEVVAELICGSDGGGGSGYDTPGIYRTMGEIHTFFQRAGVAPRGQSGTRKWFVLESLQSMNGTDALEDVLRRLASPREYLGNSSVRKDVEDYLNDVLQVEGLAISLVGVEPVLTERIATVPVPEQKASSEQIAPDFYRLVQDDSLADVLSFRWREAEKCVNAEAYLAAVVMMGSILEGVLLNKFEHNLEVGNRAKSSPKDGKTGKPKPVHEWGLSSMVDVAHEVGWLQGDVKRFSHALRESRNLVHPYVQRLYDEVPDEDTCSICWPVVQAAVSDLFRAD